MWRDAVDEKMYVTGGVGTTGNEGFGEPYVAAEHLGLCRDVRGADVHDAEPPAVPGDRRQQVHRRDGARHVQQRARAACRCRAIASSTSTGSRAPATAATRAGSAPRSNAARRTSCASSPDARLHLRAGRRRRRSTSTSTCRARRPFDVGGQESRSRSRARCRGEGKSRITVSADACRDSAPSSCAFPDGRAIRPAPGGLYSLHRRALDTADGRGQRHSGARDAGPLGYVTLDRVWKNGDAIDVEFPIEPRQVVADARVTDDARPHRRSSAGRSSIARNGRMWTAERARPADRAAPALTTAIDRRAIRRRHRHSHRGARASRTRRCRPSAVTLIPYYLWANRGAGEMSVWLSTRGVCAAATSVRPAASSST